MDDLLVLILTLLVAAIGIIGQTKKRKAANQQPQTGKSPQNFWDILESQMNPEIQNVEQEPAFEVEDEPVDVVPQAREYNFEAENEGKSVLKENSVMETFDYEKQKSKKEKFPLRKAVIYSEILRRKYI